MKKTLSLICFIASAMAAHAQQSTSKNGDANVDIKISMPDTSSHNNSQIFTAVEHEPEFKGGTQAFYKYLSSSVHYPAEAVKNHIQGKVFISFIVEKDGSLSDLKIVRSVSPELDAETMRVIKDSPKWNPGTQNGRPVRVAYTMPISFTLAGR